MIHPQVSNLKEETPYFFSASACSFYVLEIIVIIVIFKGYYFKVQVLFDS